jgi:carboxyl-terminal processing protease
MANSSTIHSAAPATSACRLMTLPLAAALLALAACGGGGGNSSTGNGNGSDVWTAGLFLPSSSFAAQCVSPRSGNHPITGQTWPDVAGTRADENNFLRSWSNETYLWYDEIIDQNPALFASSLAYFEELKTEETTASGAPKDKFHFTYETDEWLQLSQSGVSAGYGAEWIILSGSPPRKLVVAYTQPNSPATQAGVDLARGAEVLSVDGADLVNGNDVDTLNAGLFPSEPGETHTFTVRDLGAADTREITMVSTNVTATPVQNVTTLASNLGPDTVGYLVFNDHIATAESGLKSAIEQLDAANISELIVDVRYNGGGFLAIASQLAYMIAGDTATAGRIFEAIEFNDQHPTTNPVTGQPLQPMPFFDTTAGISTLPAGQPLPTLDLPRVFMLTGPNTCSASESIMNSLRGVGVEVIQIGSTTCGKPYGFYPTDNCGTTYFTIQFRGVNDQGFGDYTDGFSPQNTTSGFVGESVPGCSVADDFEHALGDPLERRLQAALGYLETGSCPAPSGVANPGFSKISAPLSVTDGLIPRTPWRENRILHMPDQPQ